MAANSQKKKTAGWKSHATKERIQKAALEMFSRKGFAATSTRMIARRAKTNIALISRYFGGKEQLFKQIVQEEVGRSIKDELDYPAQNSLREELSQYINSVFHNSEANIDFYRTVTSQALVDRKFSNFLLEAILPQEDLRLRVRLDHLKANGIIGDDCVPQDLSLSTMAFVTGHLFYSFILFGKSKEDLRENIESFLNVVCGKAR